VAVAKIREYLQDRAGHEVSYEELLAARLSPTQATLNADLSRLVADPRNGITRVGDERVKGTHRSYRYDKPPEPEPPKFVTLRLIGKTEAGNRLAQDDEMRIFEIIPVGRLLVRLAEQAS
jgi:hypothetical protein